ncbi:unnamed protein product [Trichogramma brassicae]|uniref:Uncharacterized protein n=1 Tax=Trichogramma brassicae TaxID=86971 RepID=A0A6H5I578_9HYME|nr:unnamed protein product [Trichogramma brassicae]
MKKRFNFKTYTRGAAVHATLRLGRSTWIARSMERNTPLLGLHAGVQQSRYTRRRYYNVRHTTPLHLTSVCQVRAMHVKKKKKKYGQQRVR